MGSKPKACRNYRWRAIQAEKAAKRRALRRGYVTVKRKQGAKVVA